MTGHMSNPFRSVVVSKSVESAESIRSLSYSIESLSLELEGLEAAIGEGETITVGLEGLVDTLESLADNGVLTKGHLRLLNHAHRAYVQGVSETGVGMESLTEDDVAEGDVSDVISNTTVTVATESIKSMLTNSIKAVGAGIKKVATTIIEFIKKLFLLSERLIRRQKKLTDQIRKVDESEVKSGPFAIPAIQKLQIEGESDLKSVIEGASNFVDVVQGLIKAIGDSNVIELSSGDSVDKAESLAAAERFTASTRSLGKKPFSGNYILALGANGSVKMEGFDVGANTKKFEPLEDVPSKKELTSVLDIAGELLTSSNKGKRDLDQISNLLKKNKETKHMVKTISSLGLHRVVGYAVTTVNRLQKIVSNGISRYGVAAIADDE